MKVTFRSTKKMVLEETDWVYLDREKFEFWDLYNTLQEMNDGLCNIEITDDRMAACLTKIKVLKHRGSRRHLMGASKGPKFKTLFKQLDAKAKRLYAVMDKRDKERREQKPVKDRQQKKLLALTKKARSGDDQAAKQLVRELAK